MTTPDRIPISYEPGDHTGWIGTYQHGTFLGAIVMDRPTTPSVDGPSGAEHWYAVLHLFGHDGAHTSSQVWDAGPHEVGGGTVADRARVRLDQLVAGLPGAQRRDIAIRPFRLIHDGITFGLILDSHPEYGEWADLLPNGLRFHAPWDGEYET